MKSTGLDDLQVNIDEILQEYNNETNSVSLSLKLNISLDGNNVSKNISISPRKKDKENSIVSLEHVTKDYGLNRGIFDVSFDVKEGECFGLVGENGAGKTTTLRHIMGFIKPKKGKITVAGYDAFKQAESIKSFVGYCPGEINFPPLKDGSKLIDAKMQLLKEDYSKAANELIKEFQFNIMSNPKRMSKGMKQKMALVLALMHNPKLLILDEPTTGLDPLMQDEIRNKILDIKSQKKTIIMSSNLYDELDLLCDRVALISQGHIIAIADNNAIKNREEVDYKIEFINRDDYLHFKEENRFEIIRDQEKYSQLTVEIKKADISALFGLLKDIDIKFISQIPYTLETYFNKVLKEKEKKDE